MKKFVVILLCVILAASIIFGFVYYRRQLDTKADLQVTQEEASDLDQKVAGLNQEISSLTDQLDTLSSDLDEKKKALEAFQAEFSTKDTLVQSLRDQLAMSQKETVQLKSDYDTLISELTELKKNRERIPEIESSIFTKDEELSQMENVLQDLEKDYNSEVTKRESLKAELSTKDTKVQELQDRLKETVSRIQTLENNITKSKAEIEALRNQISELQKEKAMAENRIGQIEGKYANLLAGQDELKTSQKRVAELEENVLLLKSELNEEKSSKEALENDLAGLRKQLQDSQSWADSLENELGKDKTKITWLQQQHEKLALEKSSVEDKLGEVQSTYNELVNNLKRQIQNQEVTIKTFQEKISVSFVDHILFKTGKATITPAGQKVLQKVGKTLKNVKGKKILVVGHTDDVRIGENYRYKYPSNWELSAARAARVVRFFQDEAGVDPKTMEAVGRSYYDPVDSNETAAGRAQNRRVNIIIAPSF